MKVGIVGSRRWKNRKMVETLVNELPDDTVIISGGCRGVDTWAADAAHRRGLEVIEFLPDLPKEGPRWKYTQAYHARNKQIAASADVVYAFVAPDRKGGTESTIKHARKLGTQVLVITGAQVFGGHSGVGDQ